MTDKKPSLEFIGTLADVKTSQATELAADACAEVLQAGIDPCSSAGLD